MKKPTLMTIIIIIALIIIALYAAGEINYFSYKQDINKNYDSPVVIIEKIGVEEKINNHSISEGVYHEQQSYKPTKGEVILFGHRTLQGSPFLRLNELTQGDKIIIEWPGIGEIKYSVNNSKIVPASYLMNVSNETQKIYLITCDPIGSTENRLIVEADMVSEDVVDNNIIKHNPQEYYGLIIATAFLCFGLIVSYFYPAENRVYIFSAILIISIILFYFYLYPIPSDIIYSKINFLNGGFLNP